MLRLAYIYMLLLISINIKTCTEMVLHGSRHLWYCEQLEMLLHTRQGGQGEEPLALAIVSSNWKL